MTGRTLRYTARKLADIETRPGCWSTQRVGVFDGAAQVGEYVYGYSNGLPFYAFEQDGQWMALASLEDYTATHVLRLPECTPIGEPQQRGFCPVEFYVPAFYRFPYTQTHEAGQLLPEPRQSWLRIYDDNDYDGEGETPPDLAWVHERWGFRSGCVWGDDGSWKLHLLDLLEAKAGRVKHVNLGYVELAANLPLRECLRLWDEGDAGVYRIEASVRRTFDLPTALRQGRDGVQP